MSKSNTDCKWADWLMPSSSDQHEYIRVCEKCKKRLTIIQTGEELQDELVDDLLEFAHVQEPYDSYYAYFMEYDTQVDVKIQGNGKCED